MYDLKKESRLPLVKSLVIILLVVFIIALIWIIVFKCNVNEQLNIDRNLAMSLRERFFYNVPFAGIIKFVMAGSVSESLALIFNVFCFLPFGVLLSFLLNGKASVLIGFVFSTAVEIFQLFSGWGGFDFTDIFLNTLGAVIGAVLYRYIFCKFSDKTVCIISCVFLAVGIPLDVYAVINTIMNFPV